MPKILSFNTGNQYEKSLTYFSIINISLKSGVCFTLITLLSSD